MGEAEKQAVIMLELFLALLDLAAVDEDPPLHVRHKDDTVLGGEPRHLRLHAEAGEPDLAGWRGADRGLHVWRQEIHQATGQVRVIADVKQVRARLGQADSVVQRHGRDPSPVQYFRLFLLETCRPLQLEFQVRPVLRLDLLEVRHLIFLCMARGDLCPQALQLGLERFHEVSTIFDVLDRLRLNALRALRELERAERVPIRIGACVDRNEDARSGVAAQGLLKQVGQLCIPEWNMLLDRCSPDRGLPADVDQRRHALRQCRQALVDVVTFLLPRATRLRLLRALRAG
mmetsp:Transcript_68937/g.211473  ORF Transcript_68937/g.211473 Transcript_68937/m.211473 type:complete len:288 (-) Transcript_68937:967-1830(-)